LSEWAYGRSYQQVGAAQAALASGGGSQKRYRPLGLRLPTVGAGVEHKFHTFGAAGAILQAAASSSSRSSSLRAASTTVTLTAGETSES
jgi:hypothetical protein